MKVAFYTLGCKVNQYESNSLMEEFVKRGYSIVHHDEMADVYVINTCTVTHLADRKSRQYIKRMKKVNPGSIVAAIGCYVEVSPQQVEAIEGVDIILGNKEKHELPRIVDDLLKADVKGDLSDGEQADHWEDELAGRTGPAKDRTRAFIKIQEGCNRFCSYCIIPYARGPVCSRTPQEVLTEAQGLLDKGYKELVLTGINTALYGTDFANATETLAGPAVSAGTEATASTGPTIDSLVGLLNSLAGDFRIRLGSLEPNVIDWRLAEKLLKYEKLAHHMHLSLQSGSDTTLAAMNRRYLMEDFNKIVNTLRDADPNYGISTDIIVGFPGETQEDFQESIKAIKENKFVKTHAFPFSVREGTKAAGMPDQIDSKTKKARNALMIQAGEESAQVFIQGMIGKEERVLVEEMVDGYLVGHTGNFIKTYIDLGTGKNPDACINTFLAVNIKEAYDDGVKAVLK